MPGCASTRGIGRHSAATSARRWTVSKCRRKSAKLSSRLSRASKAISSNSHKPGIFVTRSDQTCSGGFSRFNPIVLATLLMVILPLGARAEPKAAVDPDLTKSDAALLQDDAKATAELQRRLRDQVSSRGGLLVIVDRSGTNPGVTVVPATIM